MKAYFTETIKESKPTLIAFVRAAGQDAVEVKYLVDELKGEFGDKLNVERVDVSFNHHIADKFRLTTYPTWVIFKEGQELMRESGRKTASELENLVRRAM